MRPKKTPHDEALVRPSPHNRFEFMYVPLKHDRLQSDRAASFSNPNPQIIIVPSVTLPSSCRRLSCANPSPPQVPESRLIPPANHDPATDSHNTAPLTPMVTPPTPAVGLDPCHINSEVGLLDAQAKVEVSVPRRRGWEFTPRFYPYDREACIVLHTDSVYTLPSLHHCHLSSLRTRIPQTRKQTQASKSKRSFTATSHDNEE